MIIVINCSGSASKVQLSLQTSSESTGKNCFWLKGAINLKFGTETSELNQFANVVDGGWSKVDC